MDVAGVPNSLVKVARVSQKHPKGKLPEKRSIEGRYGAEKGATSGYKIISSATLQVTCSIKLILPYVELHSQAVRYYCSSWFLLISFLK